MEEIDVFKINAVMMTKTIAVDDNEDDDKDDDEDDVYSHN